MSGSAFVGGFFLNTPVDFAPAPNTVINDPLYGTVTLNEQIVTNTPSAASITVNAVHIHRFPADDIILGQVHCDVTFAAPPTTTTTASWAGLDCRACPGRRARDRYPLPR